MLAYFVVIKVGWNATGKAVFLISKSRAAASGGITFLKHLS